MHDSVHMASHLELAEYTLIKRQINMQRNFYISELANLDAAKL